MSRHATAKRFIERAIAEYPNAPCPNMTAAAFQMAVELSYAQGDISDSEHTAYTAQYQNMFGIQPIRRSA
ncbi:hypothetical protein K5D32_02520 [Pseudomonas cichorii]|uniref:hypothetical protein n=1 Tax=Pseudomonas cichorii TaxID=36746 RepID=UPI001C8A0C60|nr:hypothetical protein [Pseudomonas cichorii]MBX8528517.1 hypothetical protein [Pseudomonas cichorii]